MIMKKFALTICALAIVMFSFGQKTKDAKPAVNVDKSKLQFNIGLLYAGADLWFKQDITLGLEGSFGYNYGFNHGGYGLRVAANGNYHFNRILQLPEKIDLYAGVSAGPCVFWDYSDIFGYYDNSNRLHLGIGLSSQVGARFKINNKMWLHVQAYGGTFSGGTIGFTFRK